MSHEGQVIDKIETSWRQSWIIRNVPDGEAVGHALAKLLPQASIGMVPRDVVSLVATWAFVGESDQYPPLDSRPPEPVPVRVGVDLHLTVVSTEVSTLSLKRIHSIFKTWLTPVWSQSNEMDYDRRRVEAALAEWFSPDQVETLGPEPVVVPY